MIQLNMSIDLDNTKYFALLRKIFIIKANF